MKIVIIQGAFLPVPPIQGGAVEKIWHRMGEEFAASGHDVTHISKKVNDLPINNIENEVHHIRIKGYETPKSLIKLKFLDLIYSISSIFNIPKKADIIVTNTFWLPFLLRGKAGRKVYVDVQRVPRGQMKFYNHVGKLRACSPAIYSSIVEELKLADRHLVSYVANPVPFDVPDTGFSKRKTLLFVGRLHKEKGVDILIKAFKALPSPLQDDWTLQIVGPHELKDGGGGDEYLNYLKNEASGSNIVFEGPVFKGDVLQAHYAASSIFCYPAQDGSGDAAPVAPREAMAYGAVPIVSQLPCFSDFIENEQNSLTFNQSSPNQIADLTSCLIRLMTDENLLAKLSINGVNDVRKYSPKIIANEFLKDFENLQRERR